MKSLNNEIDFMFQVTWIKCFMNATCLFVSKSLKSNHVRGVSHVHLVWITFFQILILELDHNIFSAFFDLFKIFKTLAKTPLWSNIRHNLSPRRKLLAKAPMPYFANRVPTFQTLQTIHAIPCTKKFHSSLMNCHWVYDWSRLEIDKRIIYKSVIFDWFFGI